ncbi:zinc-binding dehydrogenase [Ktedonosporobacter rubrisoli]|uniref:zinc-binding dehydrogenase n=1 Tax=Ktedonosporobacter rubrisoli TaxID=2509675 RepID=UPI001F5C61B7|nr:zinc-binding dehydrogenase [Ktedonosporobacter rubrisoli]
MLISLLEEPPQEMARALGIRASQNWISMPFPSTSLLQAIAQVMAEGSVRATIGRSLALHEAPLAHELSETGHGRGRIVLQIAG